MPDPQPAATVARRITPLALAGRIGSTVALWAVVGGALIAPINWLRVVVIAFFGLLGTIEFALLMRAETKSVLHSSFLVLLSVFYWGVILISSVHATPAVPWWLDGMTLILAVQGAFVLTFTEAPNGAVTMKRVFGVVFGFAYTTIGLGYLARVLFFQPSASGALLLFFVIVVTKFGDVGAFALGSLIGKHQLIPQVSPAKTWEGLLGAIGASVAVAAIVMVLAGARLAPLTWPHVIVLALLLSAAGVLGDLAESVLKRCHGIKDSGHVLPGIGGILDLTDSMLFSGPVAFYYLAAIS
jgi:phosphatidate cytidylyltransferase